MSDGDALLKAILEAPDDDLPRLAFADWLDENARTDRADGRAERARWIRAGVALGRPVKLPGADWEPWSSGASKWAVSGAEFWEWRGGFVSRAHCPMARWLAYGPQLVVSHPITLVDLDDVRPFEHGRNRWVWTRSNTATRDVTHGSTLERALFRELPLLAHNRIGAVPRKVLKDAAATYPSWWDAVRALSEVLIRLAKKQAAQLREDKP